MPETTVGSTGPSQRRQVSDTVLGYPHGYTCGDDEEVRVKDVHDIIIIGGGPAGYTAAIYAARANLSPYVAEGFGAGGQLMLTTDVENFPGFTDGIQGPELMQHMRGQAERFGARPRIGGRDEGRPLLAARSAVWVDDEEHLANSVIISTGASARWLDLPSESRLRGFGVSTCATCDGFFFRDKPMVVVGGGDSAMEEALFLARMASSVTIVHRREEFRASSIMVARVLENEKINVRWNAVVEEVVGDEKVEAVRVRDTVTGELEDIPAAAMFVAIGHDPNTGALRRPDRPRRVGLRPDRRHADERRGRLRLRRRAGHDLQAGDHGGRQRMHGGHGRREVAGGGYLVSGEGQRDARRGRRPVKGKVGLDGREAFWRSPRTTGRARCWRTRSRCWSTSGRSGAARAA